MGSNTQIKLTFKNDGVAPIFEDSYAYIALLDENDRVVTKFGTDIDAKKWAPDQEVIKTVDLSISGVEKGKYKLAFGLFQNQTDETPAYLFGSEGKTEDKWYVFGETEISD